MPPAARGSRVAGSVPREHIQHQALEFLADVDDGAREAEVVLREPISFVDDCGQHMPPLEYGELPRLCAGVAHGVRTKTFWAGFVDQLTVNIVVRNLEISRRPQSCSVRAPVLKQLILAYRERYPRRQLHRTGPAQPAGTRPLDRR